jgi:hypothetical protein
MAEKGEAFAHASNQERANGDHEGDAAFALAFASQQYSVYSK